ncbi:hypothetical protein pb186bvf_011872 [Paramecium bursaria]
MCCKVFYLKLIVTHDLNQIIFHSINKIHFLQLSSVKFQSNHQNKVLFVQECIINLKYLLQGKFRDRFLEKSISLNIQYIMVDNYDAGQLNLQRNKIYFTKIESCRMDSKDSKIRSRQREKKK